ncbi:hypothetical protein ILYODFUR_028725 [Ilyodon furcidens]|uniref:Uncharacterized protein n=1 Tax=Ilyodon furcidens TaxID=33524 RepID=A0ABV0T3P8_9TELE
MRRFWRWLLERVVSRSKKLQLNKCRNPKKKVQTCSRSKPCTPWLELKMPSNTCFNKPTVIWTKPAAL